MKAGFYKKQNNDGLLYAENSVEGKGYQLTAENHDSEVYPVDDWYWFEDLETACAFFELDISSFLDPEEVLN